jgi:hypothetical protein
MKSAGVCGFGQTARIMKNHNCPSDCDLSDFAVGKIQDEQAFASIDSHLEVCPSCLQTIQTLSERGDELITAIQRGRSNADYDQEPQCQQVLDRVLGIASCWTVSIYRRWPSGEGHCRSPTPVN